MGRWTASVRRPASGIVKAADVTQTLRTDPKFEASWQAAGEHPDVLEAAASREALSERWSELVMRVATTPAKTPEGVIAKVVLIASGYAEDERGARCPSSGERPTWSALMTAAAKRMLPLGLWARLLVRLWLARLLLRKARLLRWLVKTLRL
jgi:hypothetical protein